MGRCRQGGGTGDRWHGGGWLIMGGSRLRVARCRGLRRRLVVVKQEEKEGEGEDDVAEAAVIARVPPQGRDRTVAAGATTHGCGFPPPVLPL